MGKVFLYHITLISLWCISWAQDLPLPPNLSPDIPIHKSIIQWYDHYNKKSSEMSAPYQSGDQREPSKQDLVNPLSYSSINDAIKLASNSGSGQQQNGEINDEKNKNFEDILRVSTQSEKPVVYGQPQQQNSRGGTSDILIPYAFSQPQNGQKDQNIQLVDQGIIVQPTPPQIDYGQLLENRKTIEKLDPFIQEHIRRLQEQSGDGRTVLVEVKGDDTANSDKTLLEKLRPMLYDPSVLDQLKPRLQDTRSLILNQQNTIPMTNPLVFEHKKPTLQSDKPLLQQKDIIERLRQTFFDQQNIGQQPGVVQYQYQPQPHPQLQQQPVAQQLVLLPQNPVLLSDQKSLLQQLEALAVRPLVNQYQTPVVGQQLGQTQQNPAPTASQVLHNPQPVLNLGQQESIQSTGQQNSEPILLGQRARTTQPQQQQGAIVNNQHLVTNWNQGQSSASEEQPQDGRSKRQQGQYELTNQWEQSSLLAEEDSGRKRQLREQLIRELEEQERKRAELIQIDQDHRQMIAEERRKQEVRDQQDAERRALEKQEELARQQKNQLGRPRINQDNQPPTSPQPTQRWAPQNWPQNVEIRNQVVDSAGPKGPIDVLHTIQEQPVPQYRQQQPPRFQQHPPTHQQNIAVTQPQPIPVPQNLRSEPQTYSQIRPEREQSVPQQYIPPQQQQPAPHYRPSEKPQPVPQQYNQLPQQHLSPQQQPQPVPQWISNEPKNSRGEAENAEWKAVEAALGELEKQERQQQTRRPLDRASLQAALAQAEQTDAEYVKMLREILLNQNQQSSSQPKFVPVEAPPTGVQLTTTQASGQQFDNNWWSKSDPNLRQ